MSKVPNRNLITKSSFGLVIECSKCSKILQDVYPQFDWYFKECPVCHYQIQYPKKITVNIFETKPVEVKI
ncbi:MAG: hypothetical protein D4R96_03395 [Nitrosopumilaceae archaeon]|nr:MAG: hypothetical protein D4R96_03395 [Nitrosopumilaceae archaeon]